MREVKIGYIHPSGKKFKNHKDALEWWDNNEFDTIFEELELEEEE